jgi:predicted lipoprotein
VRSVRVVAALVAGALSLSGCVSDDRPDRTEVMEALVDQVMVPAQIAMADAAGELVMAVEAACAAPSDATLTDVLPTLNLAVRARWSQRMLGVGPTDEMTATSYIDWPLAVDDTISLLVDDADVTVQTLRAGASGRRGMGAIGLLLAGEDAEVRAASPEARCAYVRAATQLVHDEAAALVVAWRQGSDGDPAYRDLLIGDAPGGRTTQGALDELIQAQAFTLDELAQDPMQTPGVALATMVSGAMDVAEIVYDDARLGGVLPTAQAEQLRGAIAAVRDALADGADRDAVLAAVENVRVSVRTDVVSSLDVIVGFSDNDGDSG